MLYSQKLIIPGVFQLMYESVSLVYRRNAKFRCTPMNVCQTKAADINTKSTQIDLIITILNTSTQINYEKMKDTLITLFSLTTIFVFDNFNHYMRRSHRHQSTEQCWPSTWSWNVSFWWTRLLWGRCFWYPHWKYHPSCRKNTESMQLILTL